MWIIELVLKLEGCSLFIQQIWIENLLWTSEPTDSGVISMDNKNLCSLEIY